MTEQDKSRNRPEDNGSAMEQNAAEKPLARSVEIKLKKLRERLARKEALERVKNIPPGRAASGPCTGRSRHVLES